MYSSILVPTDGSEGAEVALEHAESLAESYGAEIHLLFVADVRTQNTGNMAPNMIGELQETGEEAVESMKEKLNKGIDVKTEVETGIPHREINEYVEEKDVDMIAMGTHGRTGLGRVLLGSVTEKVVRTSEVPVLTVGRED